MNTIWCIEVQRKKSKKWMPVIGASFCRKRDAVSTIPGWNKLNPRATYRATKYVAKEVKP